MTKDKELLAKKCLIEELDGMQYLDREDGCYKHTLFAEYDDKLPEKAVEEILSSKEPEESLLEAVVVTYEDYMSTIEWEIVSNALRHTYPKDADEEREITEYLQEQLSEILEFEFPFDHFEEQDVDVDLMIDTGDGNYDYSLNSVYPHWSGEKGEGIEEAASLVWLAEKQGYTKVELEKALEDEEQKATGFLGSVVWEVANATTSMNCLTFLAKMKLKDLIKLNKLVKLQEPEGQTIFDARKRPDCGTVKIGRQAVTGLYDPWNGAGGLFEIGLEKDVELPVKYIRSCLPDAHNRWSVESIWGMMGSCWKDVVSGITGPEEKGGGSVNT